MDLARFALEKRLISAVATDITPFAGYFAYAALPRFEDPEFVIRQAQIITPYPGASAEQVAEEVTEDVENALQQLQGVDEVRSVSFWVSARSLWNSRLHRHRVTPSWT